MIDPTDYGLLGAFAVGVLHVLQPCEDKAVVAAYVASRGGRSLDTMVLTLLYGLGMLVANTSLGFLAALAGAALLADLSAQLSVLAGVATLALGVLMVWQARLHGLESHCLHGTIADLAKSRRGLLLFGLARGLVPCPVELAMLAWAASVKSAFFGALLVFSFSLGTILSLLPFGFVAGGLLTVLHKRFGSRVDTAAPLVAGLVMVALGLHLLLA